MPTVQIILISDSLLMSVTLAFLWMLAQGTTLPPEIRISGVHKWVTCFLFSFVSFVAIASTIWGLVAPPSSSSLFPSPPLPSPPLPSLPFPSGSQ